MERRRAARRRAWAVLAVVAWGGVAVTVLLSALGWYAEVPPEAGLYGDDGEGAAGVVSRVTDTLSYFTLWSGTVVALAATALARSSDDARWRRVLLLDALLMTTVTAIVYQLLLAPSTDVQGWSLLTDPWLHVVTPLATLVVWLGWGPRGWVTGRLVPSALVVPVLWVGWMLARGAVLDAYPYGFVAVSELGYPRVLLTVAVILVFGLVVAAALWAVDRALVRREQRAARTSGPASGPTSGPARSAG